MLMRSLEPLLREDRITRLHDSGSIHTMAYNGPDPPYETQTRRPCTRYVYGMWITNAIAVPQCSRSLRRCIANGENSSAKGSGHSALILRYGIRCGLAWSLVTLVGIVVVVV